jgi:hypothetical protein
MVSRAARIKPTRPAAGLVPLHDLAAADAARACYEAPSTTPCARTGHAPLPLTGTTGYGVGPGTLGASLEEAVSKSFNRVGAGMRFLRERGAYGIGLQHDGDRRGLVLQLHDAYA